MFQAVDISYWAGMWHAPPETLFGLGRVERSLGIALQKLLPQTVRYTSFNFGIECSAMFAREGIDLSLSLEKQPSNSEILILNQLKIGDSYGGYKQDTFSKIKLNLWRRYNCHRARNSWIKNPNRDKISLIQFDYNIRAEQFIPNKLKFALVHDIIPITHPQFSTPSNTESASLRLRLLSKEGAHFICVSKYTADELMNFLKLDKERVHWFQNGLDNAFKPNPNLGDASKWRKKLAIQSDQRYFIAQAGDLKRKNLISIMRAMKIFRKLCNEDIILVIVGQIRNLPSEFDLNLGESEWRSYVRFTGTVQDSDFSALYSSAISLIFLSLAEGFGFPPLEAMACGLPVIASNLTSVPEVVGDSGILVDPTDCDEITNAMLKVALNEPFRISLRNSALSRCQSFTWEKAAQRTVDAWRKSGLDISAGF
ncbi:glycosyltransferase family 4 protein [Luteolibacter pohnpeiensis]|uniref:Glycosyltransferase family 4 protein n=1 Tax=Luteolibacter pohnpeiensis TaxID=454153 RepID=A0A934S735_9BACT|nr:glycosyltransferase family 1 protein [Luteolibacter pohnpeiensis]MBK1882480.1 glycosyltransferase family 4 protein [Luteolibacter pohnpeiensis]